MDVCLQSYKAFQLKLFIYSNSLSSPRVLGAVKLCNVLVPWDGGHCHSFCSCMHSGYPGTTGRQSNSQSLGASDMKLATGFSSRSCQVNDAIM